MKLKAFVSLLVLMAIFATNSQAQMKIAHCNIQVVLGNMPETMTMEQDLNTYRQKCSERLANKEKVAQDKYNETIELLQKNAITEEEAKKREDEILKLQQELKDDAQRYERELGERQADLLGPISEKLKKVIDDIAKADGYTYVLNSMDAGGTSIVLVGPEQDDITKRVMDKLGIKMQEAPKAPAASGTGIPAGGK